MNNKKYSFNRADMIKILHVIGWSAASAIIATLIAVVQDMNVPAQYAVLIPVVNSVLYALKRFVEERKV